MAWFNTHAIAQWYAIADRYTEASKNVLPAAGRAGEQLADHLRGQVSQHPSHARWAGSIRTWEKDGGIAVGARGRAAGELVKLEYGVPGELHPTATFSIAASTQGPQIKSAFERELFS